MVPRYWWQDIKLLFKYVSIKNKKKGIASKNWNPICFCFEIKFVLLTDNVECGEVLNLCDIIYM